MERYNISELAKKYGITNEQMMYFLINNNIAIDNLESEVNISEILDILSRLDSKDNFGEHKNFTSLKKIEIYGLFGECNYEINFNDDVNIWVSENGQGKTTILNIIVALLNGDGKYFDSLDFKSIIVTLDKEKFCFDKENIKNSKIDIKMAYRVLQEIERYLPSEVFFDLEKRIKTKKGVTIDEIDYIIRRYIRHSEFEYRNQYHYNEREIKYLLKDLRAYSASGFESELFRLKKRMNEEILFYPTYRRIEISEEKAFQTSIRDNKPLDYVKFGMRDVEDSIGKLMKKMSDDANNSYVEMNGLIISDLLSGDSIQELSKNSNEIDKHKVEVVINRIGKERIEHLDRLNDFVSSKSSNPNHEFLRYYIDRLVKIYDSQKAIDEKLSKFSAVCNKYLEPHKKIVYDEALLSLNVFNYEGKKIEFNQLSSGEKQLVSLFSKVYLDVPSSCILIIDEPELSLSIEWQKTLLEDLYNSGKVGMMLITTHSPFIFKNSFRKYTKELNMLRKDN